MKNKASHKMVLLKGFLKLVLVVSFVFLAISLINLVVPIFFIDQMEGVDVFLTKVTMVFTISAILLFVWGKLWKSVRTKKTKENKSSNVIRKIWLFFKTRHVLFGWIVVAAGIAHSLYFTIYLPEQMIGFWSGVIAFIIMIIAVVFGYYFNKKSVTNPLIGKLHLWIGVLFFITFVYHFIDSKG
ncbi:hypothetical protein [Chengkuizengella axinellae]|uniref:Iron reductase n=1 Tax=Chengkuizengella axinellae TaxID=3064388 RepID=A0ABT9J4W8_9BACL|nr:hypothetical protein [Chengkuizengella sp. 2205SS18-9]MDP5276030.1 hypothetical protein [Chengkuizengella sp. 2205SS18-9]